MICGKFENEKTIKNMYNVTKVGDGDENNGD